MQHYQSVMPSPLGELTLQATERGLTYVGFAPTCHYIECSHPLLQHATTQLAAYFAGKGTQFDLPLDVQGTPFQRAVWQVLMKVPYGDTQSYAWIARQLNNPKAVRAVGAANSKNPISIIVPCHRIIGASGKLTGYAGGLERKAWLLRHEQLHRSSR